METRRFGKTGREVSVVGFGGAPIGILETEQKQAADILNMLLDAGVNLIDTAAMYRGSEEAIGRAVGHRREEYVLVTKCGEPGAGPDSPAWSPQNLSATIERALRRLQTERIDVMLLHSCTQETLERGDALAALMKARREGKVRFVGYSGDNEAAAFAAGLPDIAVIETSINICDQTNIDLVLPKAQEYDVGVIAKRPIANAAWKDLSEQPGFYAQYAKTYTGRLAAMRITPQDLGFDGDPNDVWPEIALRFTLSQPGVHTAIIGTTSVQHARANLAAAARGPLSEAAVEKLRDAFRQAETAAGETWLGQT